MKNYIKILTLIILFSIVSTVNAAPAKVIKGNGKNPGDEICIKNECFYVLENDGTNIKMISKYNLYIGIDIFYVPFEEKVNNWSEANTLAQEIINNYGEYDDYEIRYYNGYYTGVKFFKDAQYDIVKQDEKAIGAKGGAHDGNGPQYPIYGTYWFDKYDDIASNDGDTYNEGYTNFNISHGSEILEYLDDYLELLEEDIDVYEINLPTVKEIDNVVYQVTDNHLPLKRWYNGEWDEIEDEATFIIGQLYDYISDDYSWIWETSYWTRTGEYNSNWGEYEGVYFIDSLGDLCYSGACYGMTKLAGLRPVITISAKDLDYSITVKNDGNGTLTPSKERSVSGETIRYTVTPKKGYEVSKIVIKTDNGEIIEYHENTFEMPNDNVTIHVYFKRDIINPETATYVSTGTILLLLLSGTILILSNKKRKKLS